MRQIKFRGLRTDGKGFAFGLLRKQRQRDLSQSGNGVAYTGDWEYWIDSHEGEQGSWLVIPESVGQFTGLHDKNGVEIYEGDVFTANEYPFKDDGNHNYNGVVEWIFAGFQYYLTCVNKDKRGISEGINEVLEDGSWLEVIGNTHAQDRWQDV